MPRPALTPLKDLPNAISLSRFLAAATGDYDYHDSIEPSAHLYAAFLHWCSQKRIAIMTPHAFGREMVRTGDFEPTRFGPERQRGWRGVRLRPRWKDIALLAAERKERREKPRCIRNPDLPKRIAPFYLAMRFLDTATERDGAAVELSSALFQAHLKWCEYRNIWPLNPQSFGLALTKLKIETARCGHARDRARRGIRLLPSYKSLVG